MSNNVSTMYNNVINVKLLLEITERPHKYQTVMANQTILEII